MWTLSDLWTLSAITDNQGRPRWAILSAAGEVLDTYWPEQKHRAERAIFEVNATRKLARQLEHQWATEAA